VNEYKITLADGDSFLISAVSVDDAIRQLAEWRQRIVTKVEVTKRGNVPFDLTQGMSEC